MIISSVDIGTNTVLLLVAQTDPKNNKIIPLLNEYRIPRIGKNLASSGVISADSVEKLRDILLEYNKISAAYKSVKVIATATAAFRNALNAVDITDYIFEETGIEINIISGETEAEFAYLGVSGGISDGKKRLIIDIGGGSTEIIIGRDKNILYKKSFKTGVVTVCELNTYKNNLTEYLAGIFSELENSGLIFDEAFAIAGTPTTIAAIKLQLPEFDEIIEGTNLTSGDIMDFISDYSGKPEYYQKNFSKVLNGREDLIVPGALILQRIMTNLGIDGIRVSTRGIRHGAIVNYLFNQE